MLTWLTRLLPREGRSVSEEVRREFVQDTVYSNLERSTVPAFAVMVVHSLLFVLECFDFIGPEDAAVRSSRGYVLYVGQRLLWIVGCAATLVLRRRLKSPQELTFLHRLQEGMFAFLVVYLSVLHTVLARPFFPGVTVYVMATLGVAAFVPMSPARILVFFPGSALVLVAGISLYNPGAPEAFTADVINATATAGVGAAIAWVTVTYRFRGFLMRRNLEQKNLELSSIRENLKEALALAQQSSRTKATFLATMSHEIRTPLNAVIGMAALLEKTRLTEEQKEYVSTIHASSEFLLSLLCDILDYTKIEAGKVEVDSVEFEVRKVVDHIVEMFSGKAAEKKLELCCIVDHRVPTNGRGDPDRLRQVLANLVSNAIKFTSSGYVLLQVGVERTDEQSTLLRFAVKDSGPGIPPGSQQYVFESFAQLSQGGGRFCGGTGLGLAISRQLVQLMGGQLDLTSQEGAGAEFSFTFPLGRISTRRPSQLMVPVVVIGQKALVTTPHDRLAQTLTEYLKAAGLTVIATTELGQVTQHLGPKPEREPPLIAFVDARSAGERPSLVPVDVCREIVRAGTRLALITRSPDSNDVPTELHNLADTMLTLPIRYGKVTEALRALSHGKESTPAPTNDADQHQGGKKILVVEDNLINQKLMRLLLSKMGHEPDVASDGKEALAKLETSRYDVVFMDLSMPEMDGIQVTQLFRAREESRPGRLTPVVALTAHATKEDRERCLAAGMVDYLTKPVHPNDLVNVLEWVCRPEASDGQPAGNAPSEDSP